MSREKRYLLASITASLLLGLLGLGVSMHSPLYSPPSDVYIESYKAVLRENGVLVEDYTYVVENTGKHMLFRKWRAPLYYEEPPPLGTPAVKALDVKCPPGFIAYIYTSDRKLVGPVVESEPSTYRRVLRLLKEAETRSEAGCYSPSGIEPGKYHVEYVFRLEPPILCDNNYCLLDLSLASPNSHAYYYKSIVKIKGSVRELRVAPSTLSIDVLRGENRYTVSVEEVPSEAGLRILIVSHGPFPSSYSKRKEVMSIESVLEEKYSSLVEAEKRAELASLAGGIVAVSAAPLSLLVYLVRGVERKPSKPIPQGLPPETGEKPWQVNLIYNGEAGSFTREVVAATILDLASRGILGLKWSPEEGAVITLPRSISGLDDYEKNVVDALRLLSLDGRTVSLKAAEKILKKSKNKPEIRAAAMKLFDSKPYSQIAKNAVESAKKLLALLLVAVFTAAIIVVSLATSTPLLEDAGLAGKTVVAWLLAVIAYIPPLLVPRYVYGRWKPGYLERYIAWQEFIKNSKGLEETLKHPALGPQQLRIAAYLAALGEAKKVEEALKKIPEELARAAMHTTRFFHTYYPRYTGVKTSGGGAGGGGGFGGGGAGAR